MTNAVYLDISNLGNTRRKLLMERVEMEKHNLLCYSSSILCGGPKLGYSEEWGDTREKLNLYTQMLNELPQDGHSLLIGRIVRTFKSDEGQIVFFEVCSPEANYSDNSIYRMFYIMDGLHDGFMPTYYEEMERRKKSDKPDVVQIKVFLNSIKSIEWVDNYDL